MDGEASPLPDKLAEVEGTVVAVCGLQGVIEVSNLILEENEVFILYL
jgi:hypothetical protein